MSELEAERVDRRGTRNNAGSQPRCSNPGYAVSGSQPNALSIDDRLPSVTHRDERIQDLQAP